MAKKIILTSIEFEELRSLIIESVSSEIQRHLGKQHSESNNEAFISRSEAAKLLKISRSSLYSYVKSGRLKAYRIGRRVLFKKKDIDIALKQILLDPLIISKND